MSGDSPDDPGDFALCLVDSFDGQGGEAHPESPTGGYQMVPTPLQP